MARSRKVRSTCSAPKSRIRRTSASRSRRRTSSDATSCETKHQQGVRGMRPNLSVEAIAGALAVLGTSVLIGACGGDKPANAPVDSEGGAPTGADAHKGESGCGAGEGPGSGGGAEPAGGGKTGRPA